MKMKSVLRLYTTSSLNEEWQGVWFDIAHQRFLLVKSNEYYLWSQDDNHSLPWLFYKDDLISAFGKQDLMDAKVSLDSQLIVAQTSTSSVFVIDTTTKRKWTINIKPGDDNKILSHGLIWSDHGGNSQDLIIVTVNGLELYKISSMRNQCKLSRAIPQHCYSFWYEPNHRMMLIAAPMKQTDSSPITVENRTLMMSGLFFKCEKSEFKLELLPPDKSPRFDISGVRTENISLLTLYSTLYCAILQNVGGDIGLGVALYNITKSAVTKTHVLNLGFLSHQIRTSVVDNLLICHCLDQQSSVVFDIMATRSSKVTSSGSLTCSPETVEPLFPGTPIMHFATDKDDPFSTSHHSMAAIHSTTVTRNSEYSANSSRRRPSLNPASVLSPHKRSISTTMSASGAVEGESAVTHEALSPAHAQSSSCSGPDDDDEASWDAVGVRACDVVAMKQQQQHHVIMGVQPADVVIGAHGEHELSSEAHAPKVSAEGTAVPDNAAKPALAMYTPKKVLFLAPSWVWDSVTQCFCRLKVNLKDSGHSIVDPRKCISFLSRRGLNFCAPHAVFLASMNQDDSPEAKHLMLRKMLMGLDSRQPLPWLESLFKAIVVPYAVEHRRLLALAAGGSQNMGSGAAALPSSSSGGVAGVKKPDRRGSLIGMTFSTKNSGLYFESLGSTPQVPMASRLDNEPLEPTIALHTLIPELLDISSQFLSKRKLGSQSTGVDNNTRNNSNMSPPLIPLTTRRDEEGRLVVSQMETLCHVWLPIVASNKVNNEGYLSWCLSSYIATLRAASLVVHPSLSLLLINLLASEGKFLQVSRLLQFQFFPDVAEVAMAALSLSDVIGSFDLKSEQCEISVKEKICLKSAVSALQQVGLDMLWRLKERVTVVRWLLGHGRVMEAISLCMKRNGVWRSRLSPASIPAVEFFLSAVMALETINNDTGTESSKYGTQLSLKSWQRPPATLPVVDLNATDPMQSTFRSSDDPIVSTTNLESDPAAETDNMDLQGLSLAGQIINPFCEGDKVELLYTVHSFVLEWDTNAVNCNSQLGKSKLAAQSNFPSHLFNSIHDTLLREMFGFPSSESSSR